MSKSQSSRRDFLRTSAQTATVAGLAGSCASCAWFNKNEIHVEARPEDDEITLSFERFPKLREPHGTVNVEAKDGDLRLVVLRLPEGHVVALSMECTHWGCDVDWDMKKGRFECPCHGSLFDPHGKVLEGPADEPLATYAVAESEEGIVVRLTRA
jgi:cytochrome b6-f complex iron-sulfur subunit